MRIALVSVAVLLAAITPAASNPIINLVGATQFQSAINAGNIRGFDATTPNAFDSAALNATFPGQTTAFRTTTVSTTTTPANGLLDRAGSQADLNQSVIGAYSYDYLSDPNLAGFRLTTEMFIPQEGDGIVSGTNTMGIALVDAALNVKLWTFDDTTFSAGLNTFSLNLSNGAGAGGSTGFFKDPGFDITTVQVIQFSQRGILGVSFPPVPGTGDTALWRITTEIHAIPEPGATVLLASGLCVAAVGLLRRRIVRRGF